MPALTIEQTKVFREVLLQCDDLQTHERLQAVFAVAELQAYKAYLPEARDLNERVNLVVDAFMLKQTADGQSVLGILLAALAARNAGFPIADELLRIRLVVEPPLATRQAVRVPFVVVAMTRHEAGELPAEILALLERLTAGGSLHPEAYGALRENWRPFPDESPKTIVEILLETIMASTMRRGEESVPLEPVSYTDSFFAADVDTRSATHDQLDRSGCLLVVDPLSFFHPQLIKVLQESELMSGKDHVAVLVLAPPMLSGLELYQKVRSELRTHLPRVRTRDESFSDPFFEFGVSDLQALRRRLFGMLPAAASVVDGRRPNQATLVYFANQTGRSAQGVEKAFSGWKPPS